jgi:flagellar hook-length control protein FliK
MFPIDQWPLSGRTGADVHAGRWRGEEQPGGERFSSVLETFAARRSSLPFDDRDVATARDRSFDDSRRSGQVQSRKPLPPSRTARPTNARRPEAGTARHVENPSLSVQRDHDVTDPRRSDTVAVPEEEKLESEPDKQAEAHGAQQDNLSRAQRLDVMLVLCACPGEPAVNGQDDASTGGGNEAVIVLEPGTSLEITVETMVQTSRESAGQSDAVPASDHATMAADQHGDDSAPASDAGGAVPAEQVRQAGEPVDIGAAAVSEAPIETPATMSDSHSTPEGERRALADSLQASATARPGDAASPRHALDGMDAWRQHDRAVADARPEQTGLPDWLHSGRSQDSSLGERNGQRDGGQGEVQKPGPSQAHSGFADTVSVLAADKTGTGSGGASRLADGAMPARPAVAPWPAGDERPAVVQTVSLNLEPADLGPVNVRIFMTDRIVHAHIRTDHMDFGQGMLNQQQQLEARLQHSGLEMGDLKVTVDHQQLSRDHSQAGFSHQPHRPLVSEQSRELVHEQDAQEPAVSERRRQVRIVSVLA